MGPRREILFVAKRHRFHRFEQISHIGGKNADGSRWQLSEDEAVRGITDEGWSFFVRRPGGSAIDVVVARPPHRPALLRAGVDGDVLHLLPEGIGV